MSKTTLLILVVAALFLWKRSGGGTSAMPSYFTNPLTGQPVFY